MKKCNLFVSSGFGVLLSLLPPLAAANVASDDGKCGDGGLGYWIKVVNNLRGHQLLLDVAFVGADGSNKNVTVELGSAVCLCMKASSSSFSKKMKFSAKYGDPAYYKPPAKAMWAKCRDKKSVTSNIINGYDFTCKGDGSWADLQSGECS
ncbi:MAG: hypothetical protein A3F10_00470 [Coxiella sp. RIFCSPHIGHO2_12_FULL_42_15]|nr:MAG: hypothetical protein A3F10_00470 [Coxiella sp. RIFCSPHIGHO2_12_FULL_42_15]